LLLLSSGMFTAEPIILCVRMYRILHNSVSKDDVLYIVPNDVLRC